MSVLSKVDSWQTKLFVWVGLPVIAGMGIVLGGGDLIPAWEAKMGNGVVGTFIAEREDCGRRSCSFYGAWVATDGSASRPDAILYDEPDSLRVGGTTEAVDTGARKGVFATAGGSTYLLVTGFVLAGAAAAAGIIFNIVRFVRRRRASEPASIFPTSS